MSHRGGQRPRVSAIVIFLDDELFLRESVESVFAQSYEDWELILADDGSTDGSTSIAKEYVARDSRVRYVDHPGHANRGTSATRNLGISIARGEYLAFLDSDDVWETYKLADQVTIMEQYPDVGLVAGSTTHWHGWQDGGGGGDQQRRIRAPRHQVIPPPTLASLLYPLGKGMSPSASGFMVRRQPLLRVGGFEEQFTGMYDDQALLSKLYLETPAYISDRVWDRYRKHPASMTHDFRESDYHRVRHDFLRWFRSYMDANDIDNVSVRRALRRAEWPYQHPRLALLRRKAGGARALMHARVRLFALKWRSQLQRPSRFLTGRRYSRGEPPA